MSTTIDGLRTDLAVPGVPDDILGRLQSKPVIDRVDSQTLALIKAQIAPGRSDAEVGYWLELCAYHGLDPFAHEAWIAKGKGDNDRLLVMVGRDGLRKIAQRNGLEIDCDVVRERDTFKVVRDPKTRERLVLHEYAEEFVDDATNQKGLAETSRGRIKGAWAEVWETQTGKQRGYFYAPFPEYRPTSEAKLKYSPWGSQESVMILAAAERQALRQATPLSGLLAVGEDARIARDGEGDLTAGEGSGESRGIELPPEVLAVMERAEAVGHSGHAERSVWEYRADLGPDALAAAVREATKDLDDLETRRSAEAAAIPDAETVDDRELPVDDKDLPEPVREATITVADLEDPVVRVENSGATVPAPEKAPTRQRKAPSAPPKPETATEPADPEINVEALRTRLARLREKEPSNPVEEELRDEEVVWIEEQLRADAQRRAAADEAQGKLI